MADGLKPRVNALSAALAEEGCGSRAILAARDLIAAYDRAVLTQQE